MLLNFNNHNRFCINIQENVDIFMVYCRCIFQNFRKNQFCHWTYGQLEERICIKNKDIKNPKTWRARYLYYLARYVFGFLISLFSMQIRSSNWP